MDTFHRIRERDT